MKTCPACGQLLPQAKGRRICADCGLPIARHDKWHIGNDGKLHHKDCGNPTGDPLISNGETHDSTPLLR